MTGTDNTDRGERVLIKGARIIAMSTTQDDLAEGDVLVEGGLIAEVAPSIDVADARVIDAKDKIVIPGLIDSHRHTWQSNLHVIGADWELEHYFGSVRDKFGSVYRPEDVYTSTLLGCAECIDCGTTTLYDFAHLMNTPEHADAAVEALQASGIRAVFAYGNSNEAYSGPFPNDMLIDVADAKRVRDQYFSGSGGLVTMAMSLKGPDFSSMETTEHDFKASRELGLPITVHVGANMSLDRSVGRLADAGLLGPDVLHVHCNSSFDYELGLIAESGGTVSMSAEGEMQFGMGVPPIGPFLEHGIEPGLSTDVPTVVSSDMLGAMRVLFAAHRAEVAKRQELSSRAALERPWPRLTSRDFLRYATQANAVVVGMGDSIGQIAPGFEADLTVLSRSRPGTFPDDPTSVAGVVLSSTPGDVDLVMVRGRVLKEGDELLTIDVDKLRGDAIASRDHVLTASGFTTDR